MCNGVKHSGSFSVVKSLNQLSCWEVIHLQRREGIGFLARVMYSSPPLGEMSIIIIHMGYVAPCETWGT